MFKSGNPGALFLVGFMGAGKTTVGRKLGVRLGWPFEDLDNRIEAKSGRSIAQIFAESGETAFRRHESEALREVIRDLELGPRVVALGGGAFAQPENTALLQGAKVALIFLDGAADELYGRCVTQASARPLLSDATQFRELYERRRPLYLKASIHVDTTGKNADQVAGEVACKLGFE